MTPRSLRRIAGLAVAIACLGALPVARAHADTDYKCLSNCLNAGNSTGSKCLISCTYVPLTTSPQPPLTPDQSLLLPQSRHSQFLAPSPSTPDVISIGPDSALTPPNVTPMNSLSPTTQPLGPSTNFKCVRDCLGLGYKHDLCVESCSY